MFYDGPAVRQRPAALTGICSTRYVKDIVPRYRTNARIQGGAAAGRLGHPRPARRARGAARQLGITDKSQIEELGASRKFNDACRASVMKYAWVSTRAAP